MTKRQKMLLSAKTPLKRIAKPEDVSNAVKYLVIRSQHYKTSMRVQ